jgi:hypothetical protein
MPFTVSWWWPVKKVVARLLEGELVGEGEDDAIWQDPRHLPPIIGLSHLKDLLVL